MTRIKRILMSVLLDMTYELCESRVGYIRVLGMTSVGSEILRSVKRNSELDIITKVADCKMNDIFKADIKAQLKVQIILTLAKHKYPPATRDDVFKAIFEQAENFKKNN